MARVLYSLAVVVCAVSIHVSAHAPAHAQDPGSQQDGGDLRAATQNPISSLISLPFKFTFDDGAPNGDANILSINPVVPVSVGKWNLVNRALIPIVRAPGGIAGLPSIPGAGRPDPNNPDDTVFGLGDINYSVFVNPQESSLPFIWGVGPSITIPTATDSALGSEKVSLGPTGVLLAQPSWGSVGLLVRQLWSVGGKDSRADVNNGLIEPFINYNLPDGWYLISDSVMTVNWQAPSGEKWTVPLGGGAGKLFKIGNQPINMRVESYYNVVRPDAGPDWTIGGTFQLLFPK